MTSISDGTTAIVPVIITGYETTQDAQNVFHDIIGRPDPDVSLAPAKLRAGSIEALWATESEANAARLVLTQASVFTLTDADVPSVSMRFAIDGQVSTVLEDETRALWLVTFGYREVSP